MTGLFAASTRLTGLAGIARGVQQPRHRQLGHLVGTQPRRLIQAIGIRVAQDRGEHRRDRLQAVGQHRVVPHRVGRGLVQSVGHHHRTDRAGGTGGSPRHRHSGWTGAASAGDSGIALNSPGAMGRGAGTSVPSPRALVTAWSARSIWLRLPSHSSQVLLPNCRPECLARHREWRPARRRLSGWPAITVTPVLCAACPPGGPTDGVAHRPVRVVRRVLHHALGCARNADQVAARKPVQLTAFHHGRVDRPAGDQPGRGQVEHRMQLVTDPHIQRGGRPVGEHRVVTRLTVGPDQREHEAARQAGDQDDARPSTPRATGCATGRPASWCRARQFRRRSGASRSASRSPGGG